MRRPWSCPLGCRPLACGNMYTGQWKHVHRPVETRILSSGRRVITSRRTRPHLGATRPRVGIANLGFEPPSWQCILFIILYLLVKASSLDKQMPTRGRVAPRLGRIPPAGEDASPLAGEYENSSHLLVIPLVLTLFNTPPPI